MSPEERRLQIDELSEDSEAGRKRRKAFQDAITGTVFEYQSLGTEMNQRYTSQAVYLEDEEVRPMLPKDQVLDYQPTTYPGSRLPHAWLNTTVPSKPAISSRDLAGKGSFTVLTGIGGDVWKEAAGSAANTLGITLKVFSIGPKQDYEDPYFRWSEVREIEESGCILVRPDGFVAWRSMFAIPEASARLLEILKAILSRK